MAGVESSADSQKSTSTLLFCRMCQSLYKQPKLLPCLHSFCRACLLGAVTYGSEGTTIVCPLCNHKTRLTSRGVVGVADNCFLNRMCQEYLLEVQTHLLSRSLHPTSPKETSDSTSPSSRLSNTLSPAKYTPPPSPRSPSKVQEETQFVKGESIPHVRSLDSSAIPGQYTANAIEAIQNMSRLQTKVMSLQGEALKVTYAIDQVNQSATDWHEHKEEVKKAVQRRSAQFQFFIKRMEHQLITQIDGKHADDTFYAASSCSKTELKKNLNNILHEVSVLKNVQKLGKDAEINTLSAHLLGRSVGLSDVVLEKLHFEVDFPTKTIEEIVTAYFGSVKLSSERSKVFIPEIVDFTEMQLGNVTENLAVLEHVEYVESRDTSFEEYRATAAIDISSKRRSADRRSRRYNTDLGLNRQDVKEYLAQFQTARETFRTRRNEILARGQQPREDESPDREEVQIRQRSPSRTGRVQSLDRVALPVTTRGRTAEREARTTKTVHPSVSALDSEKDNSHYQPQIAASFQYRSVDSHFRPGLIPEDVTVPFPVTKDVRSPTSLQRKLLKQSSDPRYYRDVQDSLDEEPSPEVSPSNSSLALVEQMISRRPSNSSSDVLTGRRHSEQFASLSPGEHTALEVVTHDRVTTRPVRRAISSAADRKTKMEFLRDNWQKRKEILIQSEGFVSPDVIARYTPRRASYDQVSVLADSPSKVMVLDEIETKTLSSPTPGVSDDPKMESMHQIRSRIAQYRNDLTKMDETRNTDFKVSKSPDAKLQVSEQIHASLQVKGDNASLQAKGDSASLQVNVDSASLQVKGDSASQDAGIIASRTVSQSLTNKHIVSTTSALSYDKSKATLTSTYASPTSTSAQNLHDEPTTTRSSDQTTTSIYASPTITPSAHNQHEPTATRSSDLRTLATYSTTKTSAASIPYVTGTPTSPVKSTIPTYIPAATILSIPRESASSTLDQKATSSYTVTTTAMNKSVPSESKPALSNSVPSESKPALSKSVPSESKPALSSSDIATTTTTTLDTTTTTTTLDTTTTAVFVVSNSNATPVNTHAKSITTTLDNNPTTSLYPTATTTTTTTSRYSRLLMRRTETIDVASLLAGMYSGNAKPLQKDTKLSSDKAEQPRAAAQVVNNTITTTTTTNRAAESISSTAGTTSSTTRTAAESISSTAGTTSSTTRTAAESISSTAGTTSSTTRTAAESISLTVKTPPQTTTGAADSNSSTDRATATPTTTDAGIASPTSTTVTTYTSSKATENIINLISTTSITSRATETISPVASATTSISRPPQYSSSTDTTRITNIRATESGKSASSFGIATPSSRSTECIRSNFTVLTPSNVSTTDFYRCTTENQRDVDEPKEESTNAREGGDRHAHQSQSDDAIPTDTDTAQSIQPRKSRLNMRSRFTDGVNRRHTIVIGKDAIQSALKMISTDNTSPIPLTPISESPKASYTPTYNPYHSRFTDSSFGKLEPTNESVNTIPFAYKPTEADDTNDSGVAHKIRSPGQSTRISPLSLQVIQEKARFDNDSSPEPVGAIASSAVTPPSPSALLLNAADVDERVRIREIARKKKERWRHLTIH